MKIDYKDHYSAEYWLGQKKYRSHTGEEQSYRGPSLVWEGFQFIADTVAKLLPGRSILDIGCGAGDLVSRFIPKGYSAYGIDISSFAVQNALPTMQGKIALADITDKPDLPTSFPTTFDVVMATDLLEHIYRSDLDATFDWIVSKTNKWLFFCVAVADSPFVLQKGQVVPPQYESLAVSGHVNVQHHLWWVRYFKQRTDLELRWDLGYLLQLERERIPGWKDTAGWHMGTTWILQRK